MLLVVLHQMTYWSPATSANNATASSLLIETLKNQMVVQPRIDHTASHILGIYKQALNSLEYTGI
jgi:hypothetical protein